MLPYGSCDYAGRFMSSRNNRHIAGDLCHLTSPTVATWDAWEVGDVSMARACVGSDRHRRPPHGQHVLGKRTLAKSCWLPLLITGPHAVYTSLSYRGDHRPDALMTTMIKSAGRTHRHSRPCNGATPHPRCSVARTAHRMQRCRSLALTRASPASGITHVCYAPGRLAT